MSDDNSTSNDETSADDTKSAAATGGGGAAGGSDGSSGGSSGGGSGSSSGGSSGGSSGSGSGSGAGGGGSVPMALNQQIVEAVQTTNQTVLGASGKEGAAVAYQKVAQAAAFSVQDATDYLRNVMTMASTATGVCLQLMIAKETTSPYTDIIEAATKAVTSAQQNFDAVGKSAGTVVSDFPSGS